MTRLLVIEDDAETAEEVAGYFQARGYKVTCAPTGPEGLARAQFGEMDVLVVDRMLPGMDGLAVIEALRLANAGSWRRVTTVPGGAGDGGRQGGGAGILRPTIRVMFSGALAMVLTTGIGAAIGKAV